MCEVSDPTPTAIFGIFSTYFAILGIVGVLEVGFLGGGFRFLILDFGWVDFRLILILILILDGGVGLILDFGLCLVLVLVGLIVFGGDTG